MADADSHYIAFSRRKTALGVSCLCLVIVLIGGVIILIPSSAQTNYIPPRSEQLDNAAGRYISITAANPMDIFDDAVEEIDIEGWNVNEVKRAADGKTAEITANKDRKPGGLYGVKVALQNINGKPRLVVSTDILYFGSDD